MPQLPEKTLTYSEHCVDDQTLVGETSTRSIYAKSREEDLNEVRKIVDSGLAKLQEWLDCRLQQQEDTLRSLSASQTSNRMQASPSTSSSRDRIMQRGDTSLDLPCGYGSRARTNMLATSTWSAWSNHSAVDQEQLWLSGLMGVFDQLDLNRTGSIELSEFKKAFRAVGMQDVEALPIFKAMDKSHNGTVDRMEWLQVITESGRGTDTDATLVSDFLSRLVEQLKEEGSIYASHVSSRRLLPHYWIIRHDSLFRVIWDVTMVLLLFYISVTIPYALGFGRSEILDVIERCTDMFFCCDVVLNFRTTFIDKDDSIIIDGRRIGLRYLKTWFLLDFFASVPFDLLTEGILPNLKPARLLKIGKVAKVLKLLRLGKVKAIRGNNESMNYYLESFKQNLNRRAYIRFFRMLKLTSIAFVVAHWLACFGAAVDAAALEYYFEGRWDRTTRFQKYLASMYWAMTTISTVGYGDITPQSDHERAYAMLAMVIGGALYGYTVGAITSMVTDIDAHAHAYNERLDLVQSWLDRHKELPLVLRRKLRKHFKVAFAAKTALENSAVINQLSPELRGATAFFLVHKHVRHHPMFLNFPNSALAELVNVLHETRATPFEYIVHLGDPGIGMYILVQGLARYDQGVKWEPPEVTPITPSTRFQHIKQGESFGEEILFGIEENYLYTVITIMECKFHWIREDSFKQHYKHFPDLQQQMYSAFVNRESLLNMEVADVREFTL